MENENTKHAAMTPKTQSVCKHCQYPLKPCFVGHDVSEFCKGFLHLNNYHHCEHKAGSPVAEPASTGEQPPALCAGCGEVLPAGHAEIYQPSTGKRYHARCEYLAVRPSEPSAPHTSAELACQKCVEGIHGHCSGDCECRLSKCILKVSAPQLDPRPDLDWPLDAIRKNQSAQPVSGDAPKVEELLDELIVLADWSNTAAPAGKRIERLTQLKTELLAYFPPASQTPELESPLPWTTSGDSPENPPMIWAADGDSIVNQMPDGTPYFEPEVARFIVRVANLATPASTARTDGWVSVEDGLPKATGVYGIYPPEQIDKDQGLNFSPRYFFANEDRNTYVGNKLAYGWVKDKNHKVTHWRELPAAPGSVPQAPE